jgi:hypothetical protein
MEEFGQNARDDFFSVPSARGLTSPSQRNHAVGVLGGDELLESKFADTLPGS